MPVTVSILAEGVRSGRMRGDRGRDRRLTMRQVLTHGARQTARMRPYREHDVSGAFVTAPVTLAMLAECGAIVPVVVELAPREQHERLFYGTPGFVTWAAALLDNESLSSIGADATPAQQLDNLIYAFVAGRYLHHWKQFRVVRSEVSPVWELKTPDLRVFGWFAAKDCFVAVFGDWADRVKDLDLYRGYRTEIKRIRRELGAVTDLCVRGAEPDDVLSL